MKKATPTAAGRWWLSMLISFLLAYAVTFISVWQWVLAAGVMGGLFSATMIRGALFTAFGVALAWLLYVVVQDAWVLLDQVGDIILGGKGQGGLLAAAVVALGGVLGGLGGAVGSGLRQLAGGGFQKE